MKICFQTQILVSSNYYFKYHFHSPPGLLYKLYIDGAWAKATGIGGMGIVIRSAKGIFIAGMAKKIPFMRSAQMVETIALREGLQFALDMGIRGLMVESDAKGIIDCLNRRRIMLEKIVILCDDIWLLGQAAQVIAYRYVPRVDNRVANAIAKFALRVDDFEVWLEHHPSWLYPLLEEDLPLNL
ncbi:hypothetical protein L1049_012854 [Liquidambar formosana]|uniref:RNase H type-1 domain-containing protein n=1 Tax=Liquidambar formosana TaxID=63359 RepID=A0AAP0WWI2_LIQFO